MYDMFPFILGLVIFTFAALLMYLVRRCAFDKREDDHTGRDGSNLRWCMDRVDCGALMIALLVAVAVMAYLCAKPMSVHMAPMSSPLLPRYLVMSNQSDLSNVLAAPTASDWGMDHSPASMLPSQVVGFDRRSLTPF